MNKTLSAEIISVGTELLLGEIVDTNATYIANRLRDRGVFVYRKMTIGDNLKRLVGAIQEAMSRSDIIILGGGLGPTDDDLTREAIAEAIGETPVVDEKLLQVIKKMFAARNRPMSAANAKQAWLIKSSEALDNPVGTAFGWLVRHKQKLIAALPGPPGEMKKMWTEQVEPRLPASGSCLYHKTIHTTGIGESDMAERIKEFTRLDSPGIGTYARNSGVDIRVAAVASTVEEARHIAEPVINQVDTILAPWIYGYDEETIVSAIKKMLDQRGQSFSCIESVSGGSLASEITDCPGISSCFKGSLTAYTNPVKVMAGVAAELISKHGAVSAEVALAMAKGCRKMFASDWALATTGVAGPDSLEGKKPGTAWVAVVGENFEFTLFQDWPGDRAMVKNRVCRNALQSFFKILKENDTNE